VKNFSYTVTPLNSFTPSKIRAWPRATKFYVIADVSSAQKFRFQNGDLHFARTLTRCRFVTGFSSLAKLLTISGDLRHEVDNN